MKLDSVARALSDHLTADGPKAAPEAAVEKKSTGSSGNRFFSSVYIGILLIFIGAAVGIFGQGMWGAKAATALITLLGVFITALGFLPMAARFDRSLLRSMGTGQEPKRRGSIPDRSAELRSGDDFEPVPGVTPSVTEGTTRNLDKNETKVLR
jgi:hypothetical protein